MPNLKCSGELPKVIKGLSLRDNEGNEFWLDLTQTQPRKPSDGAAVNAADTERGDAEASVAKGGCVDKLAPAHITLLSSDDSHPDDPTCSPIVQSSQSSRSRVAVRKVRQSRLAAQEMPPQGTPSDDDFVDAPPKKKPKAVVDKVVKRIGKAAAGKLPRRSTSSRANSLHEVKKKTYPTIWCSPGSVVSILSAMTKPMKDRLKSLGFEDIISFSFSAIDDRALVMFLMDHIETDPLRIVVEGKELPITPDVVHSVLGIPNGGESIPIESGDDKCTYQAELRLKCDEKGMKVIMDERQKMQPRSTKYEDLKPQDVPRFVVEELAKTQVEDD